MFGLYLINEICCYRNVTITMNTADMGAVEQEVELKENVKTVRFFGRKSYVFSVTYPSVFML